MRPPIFLYTDGSSRGNPGPGGYGAILKCGNLVKELSGGYNRTTNNRMELLAVIKGLEAIRWDGAEVHVVSDSSYVVKAVQEGWLFKWESNGFAKAKNPDLWKRFLMLYRRHRVVFHWVKGHAGHPENERCDALAVAAATSGNLSDDLGYEQDVQ
ncbi:MAG: ribonuclease HI [Candidatus Cryptobacteroides sp.]